MRNFMILGALAIVGTSQAVTFSWTGTSGDSGQTLKAKADFTAVGNVLTIVLTNESAQASGSPADTLGTLFWNMPVTFTTPSLTNAVTLGTSVVQQNNTAFGGSYDLNKEYLYNDAVTFQSQSFGHGVSSVGIGQFSTNNDTFFERMRGQGSAGSSSGDAFSIASSFGTSGAANNFPVVKNSVTFTFLADQNIDLSTIDKVGFSFGSASASGGVVPEPGTIAALGLGAVALIRRRKKA